MMNNRAVSQLSSPVRYRNLLHMKKVTVGEWSFPALPRLRLRRCGGGGETADLRPAGRTEEEQASALRPIESLLLFDKLSKPWTGQSWVRITVSSILTAAGSDRVRGHMGTAARRGGVAGGHMWRGAAQRPATAIPLLPGHCRSPPLLLRGATGACLEV